MDDDASLAIQEEEGTSTTGAVTGTIVFDSRDDRFITRKGRNPQLYRRDGRDCRIEQVCGADCQLRQIHSLALGYGVYGPGTVGYLFGYGGKDVPISDKFFLGGLDSMRGFEARTLGPKKKRPEKKGLIYVEDGKPYINNDYDRDDKKMKTIMMMTIIIMRR